MAVDATTLADYAKYLKRKDDLNEFALRSDKKMVWFNPDPKEKDTYASGEVLSEAGDDYVLKSETGEEHKIKKSAASDRNPVKFDGVEDMAELGYLNEATVLHNLRVRYNQDRIYTYSGLFLVAVNPFKRFPIYGNGIIDMYKGKRRNEMAPHIFALSDGAYRAMLNDRQNQSLLITGESGAGKTENTKKVIQYLAAVAGRSSNGTLEQQILQANPILEAFGNAKTTRNNNSSRFGKFIEIQFNNAGFISGASIVSYLLEKSRVVWQAEKERNYHIFYQLITGSTSDEKKQLSLGPMENFEYMNKSGCYDIAGVNDAQEFKDTRNAMTIMGISNEEQQSIFRILAAILHLGNMQFSPAYGEGSEIKDKNTLNTVANLLNVDASQLEKALIEPRILAGRDLVATHLNPEKAGSSRDALTKALYGRLFNWIVKKINLVLAQERKAYFIGVLDISGFEIFQTNSFEQLCINYTNERLQQFFNNHMFKLEQDEYMAEKINWKFIDFGMDSQATIDLIDGTPQGNPPKAPGILALLDEQSVFPNATDKTFVEKLNAQHGKGKSTKYEEPRFARANPSFSVSHYAGVVNYDALGWLDKNKDPLQNDLETTMKESKDGFVGRLFATDSRAAPVASKGAGKKGANFVTVGFQHKEQLASLISTLKSTNPHFVRCILPNSQQRAGYLEDKVVLDQLRCNGVLEGIKISRQGFPNRVVYAEFVKRYYLLASNVPRTAEDLQKATQAILNTQKLEEDSYRFGLTKIFFRTGALAKIEEAREVKIGELIKGIQAASRGWLSRRNFKIAREYTVAAQIIQQNLRAYLEFKNWPWWKLFAKARPMLKRRNFEKEMKDKDREIGELKSSVQSSNDLKNKLEQNLKSAENNLASIQRDLKAEQERLSNLQSDKEATEAARSELQSKVNDLQSDLEEKEHNLATLTSQKKAADLRAEELEEDLAEEQKLRSGLEKLKKKFEEELDEMRKQHDLEVETISKLEKMKNELQTELEDLTSQSGEDSKAKANLEKAKRALEANLDEVNDKLSSETKEKNELTKAKKSLEAELKALQAALDAEIATRQAHEATIKKLEAALADVNAKLDAETKARAAAEKSKKTLEQQLAQTSEELDTEKKNKETLDKKRKALEDMLEEMKDQLATGGDQAKNLLDSKMKQEQEMEILRKQIEELKLTITKLEKDKARLTAEVAELTAALEAEKTRSADLEKNKKSLQDQIEELNEQASKESNDKSSLDKAKRKIETELAQLKTSLEAETAARQAQEAHGKKLEQQLNENKAEKETIEKNSAALDKRRKALESDLELAHKQLDEEKQAKTQLERRRQEAEKQVEALNEQIEEESHAKRSSDDATTKKNAEIEELKSQIAFITGQKDKAVQALKDNEKQTADLKNASEEAEGALERSERSRKKLEYDIQDIQKLLEEEQKKAVKKDKDQKKYEVEIRQLKQQIEDQMGTTSEQYVTIKTLKEELAELKLGLESMDEKSAQLTRAKKAVDTQVAQLKFEVDELSVSRQRSDKAKKELEERIRELEEQISETPDQVDPTEIRKRDAQIADLRSQVEKETDAKNKAVAAEKNVRKEITNLEEKVEESERIKVNLDRNNKKYESDLADVRQQLEAEVKKSAKLEKSRKDLERQASATKSV